MGLAIEGGARSRVLKIAGAALFVIFLVWNIAHVYLVGSYAWDDGSITLAYARTVAEHGVFALNAVSERVEGSSSLVFVALMAGLHTVLNFGFDGFIRASQAVAFFFVLPTLWLLFRSLRPYVADRHERFLLTMVFGLLPVFTTESMNGMEMSLTAFLFLCFYRAFTASSRWVFLLIPLLLMTRFETVFYLMFALGLHFLMQKEGRRRVLVLGVYTFLCFCVLSLGRWLYFGDFLPNTVWAKMNPPYSIVGSLPEKLLKKLSGLGEFLMVNAFLAVPAVALAFYRFRRTGKTDIAALAIVAYAVFALVSGKNWGYDGRMYIAAMPLMLLVLASGLASPELQRSGFLAGWLKPGALRAGRSGMFWILLALLVCTAAASRPLIGFNFRTAMQGAYWRGILPASVNATVEKRWLDKSPFPKDWLGPSPENFRQTSLAVDKLRTTLGIDTLVYMVPDVGGSSLCCDRLNIIDTGLLTNAHMAHKGYSDFADYLEKVNPDVIETHTVWTTNSRIYESAFFKANYKPVIIDNNWLWLRKDRYAQIQKTVPGELTQTKMPVEFSKVRYGPIAFDTTYPATLPEQQALTWNTRR